MSTSGLKYQRQSTEQSSPRGAGSKSAKKCLFAASSPSTSSSSLSPSPPRRRDLIKNRFVNRIRKKSSTAVPQYIGVRYREELNKYVTEIRPKRCPKKIWLGTYDTAEEAARAFDIGNLCCNKNLPLNFDDSPTMLRKIKSNLSEEESRSAIAKLAKEVARLCSGNLSSSDEVAKPEPAYRTAMAHTECFQYQTQSEFAQFQPHSEFVQFQPHSEFVQFQPHSEFVQFQSHSEYVQYGQAFQPELPQPEFVPQLRNFAAPGVHSTTYIEENPENLCVTQQATAMAITERGDGSRSWEFDLCIGDVSLTDDLAGNFPVLDMPDVVEDHIYEDRIYQNHALYADQSSSGGQVYGDAIFLNYN